MDELNLDEALAMDEELNTLLREPQKGPVDSKNCVLCAALVLALRELTEKADAEGVADMVTKMAEHAQYGHPEDERTRSAVEDLYSSSAS
ncbi:hypothetical protein [Streptomyces parvus]|uniref:Uncharacterized protein n=1 Tax=Streptomyces parvus TaxID=66428 RepID=A0A7K3RT95_9ACTN|nr:hypothetical protein [Streptomyces parvus]NEC18428.1 hypothetical protein [Streptomyces parvus]